MTVTPITGRPATSSLGLAYGSEYADILVDLLEYVPDLMFPRSATTYSQMRLDPKLRGVLAAYTGPIRKADWAVDPAGCSDEVAEFVADQLGLPIVGADNPPGPARRRGVVWRRHIEQAVGMLVFGFYPFERWFDYADGRYTIGGLEERHPASIAEIRVDKQGRLDRVWQTHMLASDRPITADRMVWYVHEKEGANWVGRSLLRAAYGAWLIKHETWRVHGISIRRFGMGVPSIEAPQGATQQQVLEAQRLASAMRVGDTAGMGLPHGFAAKLTGLTGTVPDALAFIRYLDEQMATMALAGVLDLGHTETGSRALGMTFVDLLEEAVQSAGDGMAAESTRALSVPLVDFNWSEDEPAPRIVMGSVASTPELTADAIAQLVNAGALAYDPELEAFLRDRYQIPARDPDAPSPAPVSPPQLAAAGRRRRQIRAAADPGVLRRQPNKLEAAARTDFVAVQNQWQTELDKLVSDWDDVTEQQIAELVEQIEAAVDAGDQVALSNLSVDTSDGASILTTAMLGLASAAALDQAREAKDQGVDADPGEPDEARLGATATATAAIAGTSLATSAGRKALQVWTPAATAADVAEQVELHLTSLTGAALRDNLGGALSTAQNEGRLATVKAAPAADRYAASEVLDKNTCEPCQGIDGAEFDTFEEAEAAYANGGYSGCSGGLRCRGILVTLWDAAALVA